MELTSEELRKLYQKIIQVGIDKHGIREQYPKVLLESCGDFTIEVEYYGRGGTDIEQYEVTTEDLEKTSQALVDERIKREEEAARLYKIQREEERIKRLELEKKQRYQEYLSLKKEFE
jgi:hypothetical protein